MDDKPLVPVDDMEPCVPLAETNDPAGPPGMPGYTLDASGGRRGHPSGLNRAQRRAAYERHKAADRERRMAQQARTAPRKRRRR